MNALFSLCFQSVAQLDDKRKCIKTQAAVVQFLQLASTGEMLAVAKASEGCSFAGVGLFFFFNCLKELFFLLLI